MDRPKYSLIEDYTLAQLGCAVYPLRYLPGFQPRGMDLSGPLWPYLPGGVPDKPHRCNAGRRPQLSGLQGRPVQPTAWARKTRNASNPKAQTPKPATLNLEP